MCVFELSSAGFTVFRIFQAVKAEGCNNTPNTGLLYMLLEHGELFCHCITMINDKNRRRLLEVQSTGCFRYFILISFPIVWL